MLDPTQTLVNKPRDPRILYRCVCGNSYLVDPQMGGDCPSCHRHLPGEALREALTSTVSFASMDEGKALEIHQPLSDNDPLIGQRLGHFLLERRLGEGGMGVVYRALDTSLQRYVAVKVLRRSAIHGKGSEAVDQLLQEAVAQARLNHPNVVTIYYVGRQDDEPFLAMELVSGHTVAQQVKEAPLYFHAIIHLTVQVVEALKHASHFGIVHGDIKPSNLLIAGPSQIKLSDFGLSRMSTGETGDRSISGTPNYFAPELLDGSGPSKQSDMYALGVTLFELTFERLPFQLSGTTLNDKLASHKTLPVEFPTPWPNTVPVAWKSILAKLLAKDPAHRFRDYDELLQELKTLVPVSTSIAGIFPRLAAVLLDQMLMVMVAVPFLIWSGITAIDEDFIPLSLRWTGWITMLLVLLIPMLHIAWIGSGRRSLGRLMFQLRVVDHYGLNLERRQLMMREFVRCLPVIMFTWSGIANTFFGDGLVPLITRILVTLIILVDVGTMLFMREGMALHDYLFDSSVVLDFTGSRIRGVKPRPNGKDGSRNSSATIKGGKSTTKGSSSDLQQPSNPSSISA